jgi:hypothetical protein
LIGRPDFNPGFPVARKREITLVKAFSFSIFLVLLLLAALFEAYFFFKLIQLIHRRRKIRLGIGDGIEDVGILGTFSSFKVSFTSSVYIRPEKSK